MKCLRLGTRGMLSALIALLLIAAPAGAAQKVKLAQNASPISGVTMVAKDQGFFEDHGLDVEILGFTSGRASLESVMGGGADIATTAEAPTSAAAMAKQPIAFLARTQYSDLKTLTAAKSGISTLEDLEGKRIAYTSGTGGEVYTMKLLEKAGLTPEDVQLVNLRPQDMLSAMASNSIDAFNTWEPHVANAKRTMGDGVAQLDTAGIYAETFNIVVMQDFLSENEGVVNSFMKALIDAEAWIKANREEAILVISKAAGMPSADLAAIFDDYVYHVTLDQMTMDILDAHAKWRLESGNHPSGAKMPDFSQYIFPEPLRSAAPERIQAAGF